MGATENERLGRRYERHVSDAAWDGLPWEVTNALDPGSGDGAYNEHGHYEETCPDGRLVVVQITDEGIIADWFRDGEPDKTWAVDWDDIEEGRD